LALFFSSVGSRFSFFLARCFLLLSFAALFAFEAALAAGSALVLC
jgi:hypothetical protein